MPPGARKLVTIEGAGRDLEIGVFNIGGRLVVYRNVCPHAGAPVCVGRVCGTTLPGEVGEFHLAREGEILRCPWHGWEFDLLTGEHLMNEKMKLKSYEIEDAQSLEPIAVETEADTIFLLLPPK